MIVRFSRENCSGIRNRRWVFEFVQFLVHFSSGLWLEFSLCAYVQHLGLGFGLGLGFVEMCTFNCMC